MIQAKAYAAMTARSPLAPFSIERRDPGAFDVVVDIHYCGICHSDIHQARDEWGGSRFPMVPGHEIAGVVSQIGKSVSRFKVGDSVGVGCYIDSCRECEPCKNDQQQYCERGATYTYNSMDRKTKQVTMGGYSTLITVDENYVLEIPKNLPLDKASPLLCAGITVYSPLKKWNTGPGKTVAVVGLGGLGHMAVKLAAAMGAEVTVLSHSMKKEADGKRLGAKHFYATADEKTFSDLKSKFDLIICTVSVGLDWNQLLALLKLNGSMVVVGLPPESVPVHAGILINGHRSLAGSLIGGVQETQEMLNFCGQHNITCDIELIPPEKINEAFDRVVKSDVRYRFVVDTKMMK